MRPLFIVTSCVIVNKDVFSKENMDRFIQTINTIQSIRLHYPNSKILLCDSSHVSIKELGKVHLDIINLGDIEILDFSNNKKIIEIQEESKNISIKTDTCVGCDFSLSYIKSKTEIFMLLSIFEELDIKKYDRIFKISGRYIITNRVNIDSHSKIGKITLKRPEPCRIGEQYTLSKEYRNCMFWSFCPTIYNEIFQILLNIDKYLEDQKNRNLTGDIERGLSKYVPIDLIEDVIITGIIGRVDNIHLHFD